MDDETNGEASEDKLKILVATDNHLGYGEKDSIIKDDSFITFEEILQLAQHHKVDMILLCGNLFHDNKPSRKTVHKALSLLRKYCLGDKEIHLEYLSDPNVNFQQSDFKGVNYLDPNFNIAYPVFSVHGNRDDPTGDDCLSAIDVLSTAGMLNHIGKLPRSDSNELEVSPVLLKKGSSRLALYGIGAMRDERLHKIFATKKVNMLVPEGENGRDGHKDWFNLLVLHQNRSKRVNKNYIPECFLDDLFDLVIWGHEPECLIKGGQFDLGENRFSIFQPGSSIATSFSDEEAKQKHVGLLSLSQKAFNIKPLPLHTVRQFKIKDIVLAETGLKDHEEDKLYEYLTDRVEELINEAQDDHTGAKDQPNLPLIRIKVEYTGGYSIINPHRFGQQFVDRVANCKDILHFYRKRGSNKYDYATSFDMPLSKETQGDGVRMEDLINESLNSVEGALQLDVLSGRKLSKALNEFVLKEEKDAISELVKFQLKKTQDEIVKNEDMKEGNIDELIEIAKEAENNMNEKEEDQEIEKVMKNFRNNRTVDHVDDFDLEDDDVPNTSSKRGRGRGGGSRGGGGAKTAKTAKRGSGGRGRGRGKASQTKVEDISTSPNEEDLGSTDKKSWLHTKRLTTRLESSDEDEDYDPFSFKDSKRGRR